MPVGTAGALTYESGDVSICTVDEDSGEIIALLAEGDCDITATAAENDNYNAADSDVATITVTPGTAPVVTIADASVDEGDSGETTLSFDVSITAPAGSEVTFTYDTSDGTAAHSVDYERVVGGSGSIPGLRQHRDHRHRHHRRGGCRAQRDVHRHPEQPLRQRTLHRRCEHHQRHRHHR